MSESNASWPTLVSGQSLVQAPSGSCKFALWQCYSAEAWKAWLSMTVLQAAAFRWEETCVDLGVVCFSSSLELRRQRPRLVVVVWLCRWSSPSPRFQDRWSCRQIYGAERRVHLDLIAVTWPWCVGLLFKSIAAKLVADVVKVCLSDEPTLEVLCSPPSFR